MLLDINTRLAYALNIDQQQVSNTISLLDNGATVPFIARYRKEATGGLSDIDLRNLVEQLTYMRDLDARRIIILNSIDKQGVLTEDLRATINQAKNKTQLEDLYLPYKPKRRVKSQIAKEAGLEPLATDLLNQQNLTPETEALKYVNPEKNIFNIQDALAGAKFILMELISQNADILAKTRQKLWQEATIITKVIKDKEDAGQKFTDYFAYEERIKTIPSHRVLAILRGKNEKILSVAITINTLSSSGLPNDYENIILNTYNINLNSNCGEWLLDCVRTCFKSKIFASLEAEIFNQLRENADNEAIKVFASNLHHLLLQPPIDNKRILGLDPGIRTGVKIAAIDNTGKLLDTYIIYPFQPQNKYAESINLVAEIIQKHQIELISIGNGTASRETESLVNDVAKKYPQLKFNKIVVSEAGASVYSASEFAAKEFPNLDVSLRGAVSIARRLQDPLAELVKIDPKAIGVGQYQHDVDQDKLAQSLTNIIEDCVNSVGVDINTASVPLLTHVSGLNHSIANNIVSYRDKHGKFTNRNQLKLVSRLGHKVFEQAAGFLKIINGENPLDSSAVHPESYSLVNLIAQKSHTTLNQLIANTSLLKTIKPNDFIHDGYGLPTIIDILHELEKPGRDPRGTFKTAQFREGINQINDLQIGMQLEGVVTNVTNFGAFVDLGVHQDGLLHISQIATHYISNPNEVLKIGQIITVEVLEVDTNRKRISLSMKTINKAKDINDLIMPNINTNRKKPSIPKDNRNNSAIALAFSRLQKNE